MSNTHAKRARLVAAFALAASFGAQVGQVGRAAPAGKQRSGARESTAARSTGDHATACLAGSQVEPLRACLEAGRGPDDCVAALAAPVARSVPLCDSDGDGLGDDLEAALALAYGPLFAFNGGAHGGNPETNWPASVEHFVHHAKLVYRPDGQPGTVVDAHPSLASLAGASSGHGAHFADDPGSG